MKSYIVPAISLATLLLSACSGSMAQHDWEYWDIQFSTPAEEEVFFFNSTDFLPDASPYNSAAYIAPNASEFLMANSSGWTRLQVREGACTDEFDYEWNYDDGNCLVLMLAEDDVKLGETIFETIEF